jgi:orotate phosphoribosyltransferase
MRTTEVLDTTARASERTEAEIGLFGREGEEYARIVRCFLSAKMSYRAQLKACLRRKSLFRGSYKLASGRTSNYYLDCKLTTLDPQGSVLTGHAILDLLRQHGLRPHAIGGPTIGADPIVTGTAAASYLEGDPIPGFLIRKERKTHGREKKIEGIEPKPGLRVVIVDEVCTTGGSTLDAIAAAESEGLEIIAVLSLVDREEGGSEKIRERYPYFPVFTAKELLEDDGEESGTGKEAARDTGAPLKLEQRSG